ncbi:MAG: hypothetical protein JXR36_06045 [Bacteroidales bacterium]|nr:hypothetical protein [Bacteroidales bacterium]
MIFLANSTFFYILVFIIIYNTSSFLVKNRTLSNILLLLGSFAVIGTVCSIESIITIITISTLVYFAGRNLSKNKRKSKLLLGIYIALLVTIFVLKNYEIAKLSFISAIGLSYILFRLIHYLIESKTEKIAEYNLLSFINYIIFFPTFLAGPIDDYNNFNYWTKQKRNSYKISLIKAGGFKILLGVVKKFFLVPIIVNYSMDFSLFNDVDVWQQGFVYSVLLYSLYILFDFSGYSDIAIGTAYLTGIKTPENFDNPYFSKSLSIFWKKWHMTFSNFLFKYIFKPLVVGMSKTFAKTPRLLITFIGYIITFIICGVWHGNTLNFIYWGLFHGVGLILFKLWNIYIYKKKFEVIKGRIIKITYNILAIAITFLFVSFGWFLFNYQSNEINTILRNIGSKNDQNIKINTVLLNKTPIIEIDFSNNSGQSVDIEYQTCESDSIVRAYNIPTNENDLYYIYPITTDKTLSLIRVRSSDGIQKGNWNTKLFYLDQKDIKQNCISDFIFGKIEPIKSIDKIPQYANS